MADLTLPPQLKPTSQNFGLASQTARFSSRAPHQRIGRKNARFTCQMTFNNIDAEKRRQMIAFLAEAEGGLRSFAVPYFGAGQNSYFAELVTHKTDLTQSPWAQSGANVRYDSGVTRLTRNTTSRGIAQINLGMSTSLPYAIQIAARKGTSDGGVLAYLGTTPGGTELASAVTVEGRALIGYNTTGTPSDYWLSVGTNNGDIEGFCFVEHVSVTQAAKVVGAGQTGRMLYGTTNDAADADTVIARKGEFLEVNGEFKLITQDVRTYASTGEFVASIFPALRASPAASSIIVMREPRCKMILNTSDVAWSERPHRVVGDDTTLSDFTVNCIEVP